MQLICVDTCTWQHWFTYLKSPRKLEGDLLKKTMCFQSIYDLVLENKKALRFSFNQKIVDELPEDYHLFFKNKVMSFAQKVPIPLTRYDGSYKYDGSFLYGGKFGGTLKKILTVDGYKQQEEIERASKSLKDGKMLFETNPRKREFDIEHMESALECGAILFITNDTKTILKPLEKTFHKYPNDQAIARIYEIAKCPCSALKILQA